MGLLSATARGTVVAAVIGLVVAGTAPAAQADPIRDDQRPVLNAMNVPRAWQTSKGDGVTVAVLDTGVDDDIPDLRGAVVTGPDMTRGANPAGTRPNLMHGTNMAALIAGRGHGAGGASGVIGVAPESKILSIRVILDESEPGFRRFNGEERWADAVADGIRRAVKSGADVINLSLVRGVPTKEDRAAVAYAIAKGVVVIAGAGNDGDSPLVKNGWAPYRYPASYPGVVSVAAVGPTFRRAGFSNRNGSIVVAAPGTGITSAGPNGEYWRMSGTSPACALVSGVAALIRSRHPKLSPALVAQALTGSAQHRPGRGYDHDVGFGTVDAARALVLADRLAKYRSSGGLDPTKRFTSEEAAPVAVVHRDGTLIAGAGGASVVFLGGLVAAVVWIVTLRRRRILATAAPPPTGPAGPPPGPWPPGPAPGGPPPDFPPIGGAPRGGSPSEGRPPTGPPGPYGHHGAGTPPYGGPAPRPPGTPHASGTYGAPPEEPGEWPGPR